METIFDFEELSDYDLYHLRYGKGAVVVAIPREHVELCRTRWEQAEREKLESMQQRQESIKEKIADLKQRIKDVGEIPWSEQTSAFIADANEQLELLKSQYRSCKYVQREFFSGLQLALFYAHEIPPASERATRFDTIRSIENLGSHIKIELQFSARPDMQHLVHRRNGLVKIPHRNGPAAIIEGCIKRILPVEQVTVEIVSRADEPPVPV